MTLIGRLMTGAGVLALSTGFAAAAPAIVQNDLNLRAGPGTDYEVVAAMPRRARSITVVLCAVAILGPATAQTPPPPAVATEGRVITIVPDGLGPDPAQVLATWMLPDSTRERYLAQVRTIFHQLGIDTTKSYYTPLGRPVPIVNGGRIIKGLV